MDYNLLDSSIHGIFQARILEWVAISFSRVTQTQTYQQIIFLKNVLSATLPAGDKMGGCVTQSWLSHSKQHSKKTDFKNGITNN